MKIHIFQIKVNAGRREANPETIHELANSISKVGLMNPITVDQDYTLIAGLHRLEAAKLLGWSEVECTVSSLDGLLAELAEIDENIVRKELSESEYDEVLLRRKEIYEALHPETKWGGDRKSEKIKVQNLQLDPAKSFIRDTADKTGMSPRTVAVRLQTAKNLTPEAKAIIRNTDIKVTKTNALKLSRLPPEHQEEAASQLVAGTIRSVDEYHTVPPAPRDPKPAPTGTQDREPEEPTPPTAPPSTPPVPEDCCPSIQELASDLKNPDKDRRCTPDSFLMTFSYFLQRFCQSMENYTGPEYDAVLPVLTKEHLDQIYRKVQFVHGALDEMYHKIERMAQNVPT